MPSGTEAVADRRLPTSLHSVHGTLADVSALACQAKSAIEEGHLTDDIVGELAKAARTAVLQCYWIVDHPEVRNQVR